MMNDGRPDLSLRDDLAEVLRQKITLPCPACGSTNFVILNPENRWAAVHAAPLGDYYETLMVVCKNCGHASQHLARILMKQLPAKNP